MLYCINDTPRCELTGEYLVRSFGHSKQVMAKGKDARRKKIKRWRQKVLTFNHDLPLVSLQNNLFFWIDVKLMQCKQGT